MCNPNSVTYKFLVFFSFAAQVVFVCVLTNSTDKLAAHEFILNVIAIYKFHTISTAHETLFGQTHFDAVKKEERVTIFIIMNKLCDLNISNTKRQHIIILIWHAYINRMFLWFDYYIHCTTPIQEQYWWNFELWIAQGLRIKKPFNFFWRGIKRAMKTKCNMIVMYAQHTHYTWPPDPIDIKSKIHRHHCVAVIRDILQLTVNT